MKSHRGTQFRIWATQRLREYIVKGFSLDDERLKRAGGGKPTKEEAAIAKNYLRAEELEGLNRIVTAYLEFAELRALNRQPMTMRDWIAKLEDFLRLLRATSIGAIELIAPQRTAGIPGV